MVYCVIVFIGKYLKYHETSSWNGYRRSDNRLPEKSDLEHAGKLGKTIVPYGSGQKSVLSHLGQNGRIRRLEKQQNGELIMAYKEEKTETKVWKRNTLDVSAN